MAEMFRLPAGGRIDRKRRLRFEFDGRAYTGVEGDTLASALLANGVRVVARSFKLHRPRGVVSAGTEEPAAFVELLDDAASASQPATTVRLFDGLRARSVLGWPSARHDWLAPLQWLAPVLPAAFYYKTFMWPNWHWFEPWIRRVAGMAHAPPTPPAQGQYEVRHAHCDVLVVGCGPAGLSAARDAARAGCRVMLVDEAAAPGGALTGRRERIGQVDALDWVARTVAELDACPEVRRLPQASAWAVREAGLVLVTERAPAVAGLIQRTWRVRAKRVIVATGAVERPLVFRDNDRPGVMLAGAVQAYLHRHAVVPGRRVLVFTNNGSAYELVHDLRQAGVEVVGVVDARAHVDDGARACAGSVPVWAGHVVEQAVGGTGGVRGARVRPAGGGAVRHVDCDLIAVSGGWNPLVHLYSQARGTLRFDEGLAAFVPDRPGQAFECAGAAGGRLALAAALADGADKGRQAARALGFAPAVPDDASVSAGAHHGTRPAADTPAQQPAAPAPAYAIEPLWHVQPLPEGAKAFVDLQHDVTVADLHLALREGYGAIEHVKRYTTAGMGIDQGKTGNLNVVGAVAAAQGLRMDSVGQTTMRSPWAPVEFGALVGARGGPVFLPYRHTPLTAWHIAHGAVMFEAGARWRRPLYYPQPGEAMHEAVQREARAVREAVAMYDGSPLGKVEIRGPDALALLQMLYTNDFSTLEVGMGRYGIMLSDDGIVLDDGVSFKLGEGHYLMSTSTGNADEVWRHMQHFLQVDRPHWRVRLANLTAVWGNATICGPRARELLAALGTDIDLSNEAFPFMGLRHGRVAGFEARVARVSFTGELSFEVNVRARDLPALWQHAYDAGQAMGLALVGSETNHVLRVEKGFLSLGHEVDATADPHDLGMGWAMSRKKADYLGKRAVAIRRAGTSGRRELVGLLPEDPKRLLVEGAPLTPGGRREASEGFVSACVWSVVHDRSVALGLLADGRQRHGQTVHVRMKDEVVPVKVVAPCFHDPQGLRMRS
jgi:sarcosine oxidase subunit alpha